MADEANVKTSAPTELETEAQAPIQDSGITAETASKSEDVAAKEAPKSEDVTAKDASKTDENATAKPAETKAEEAAPAAKEEPKVAEAAKVIPKHHFTIIDLFLAVCSVFFILCCIGMITPYSNIALIGGLILVFIFISGLFYATLHLSKVG